MDASCGVVRYTATMCICEPLTHTWRTRGHCSCDRQMLVQHAACLLQLESSLNGIGTGL